ncbi:hypothetical protein K2D_09130 [Planctomycetes bacterium K2D]|uniref:Uncharacterized protein n=1 Tax=Botrimarina mediterranea TaxID=2528022 RepID=A0A518K4M7_9BACT|nr:hypothetical protein Spa11_09300 [Botrimarina mediterranea]QDV77322.1 hypothetical protein K2D_09130 [Planctomycetes bacterium K2D]
MRLGIFLASILLIQFAGCRLMQPKIVSPPTVYVPVRVPVPVPVYVDAGRFGSKQAYANDLATVDGQPFAPYRNTQSTVSAVRVGRAADVFDAKKIQSVTAGVNADSLRRAIMSRLEVIGSVESVPVVEPNSLQIVIRENDGDKFYQHVVRAANLETDSIAVSVESRLFARQAGGRIVEVDAGDEKAVDVLEAVRVALPQ